MPPSQGLTQTNYFEFAYQVYQSISGQSITQKVAIVLIASPDLPGATSTLASAGIDPSRVVSVIPRQLTVL